jgi:protein-disulfide isomerase
MMLLATVGAVIAGAIIVGVVLLAGQGPSAGTAELNAPTHIPPVELADGRSIGKADAPVTLEEWSDFQCPACGVQARETVPQLMDTYVRDGTLRITYRDAAFQGRKSSSSFDESVEPAAAARCAAEQDKFWQYHDYLFWNQDGENEGAFRQERLDEIAAAVGLDVAAWSSCLESGTQQQAVRAETDEGAAQGIDSTPTVYINGEKLVGALPYEQLSQVIEAAAQAAALDSGRLSATTP